jgi:hypothetical protein
MSWGGEYTSHSKIVAKERMAMFRKFLMVALWMGVSSAVFAEETPRQAIAACEADLAKYCAAVQPGQGRVAKCLKDNKENLSAACKADIKTVAMKIRERQAERRHNGRANTSAAQ